ncbi:ABC transporter substrate-binding protein [Tessaracoccus sp. OS52]|uniref:ABC transporter substrate-binding protein n=1 Tax=Tessaracoccus sp. OS52 TaxID=2886691 RepID=UPI00272AC447|nr:sugar ABC transporter substrate-binding protein [Tessaracoccus sp. OS52]
MPVVSRRRLFSLAAAAGAASALAACSPEASKAPDAASAALIVQIWDAVQKGGVQAAIDGFAKNSSSTVRLDVLPEDQYYQSLDASLGAGKGPDVMWQSSKAIEYVQGGAIEPLDERIAEAGIDLSQYAPQITSLYNFDGKQYGIPKDMDAWVMVYNPAILDKHGVSAPSPEWTWQDMLAIGQELLDASGNRGNIIGYDTNLAFGCSDAVHHSGGRFVSEDGTKAVIDSDEAVDGFNRILELMDLGLAPNPAERADFDALSALTSGNLAIAMIPSWQISALGEAVTDDLPLTAVRLPSSNGNFACNTNGLSYMLNANSAAKDQAFSLMAWMTSLDGARLHAANGAGLPALPAAQDAWFEANSAIKDIDAVRVASENVYLRPSTAFPKARPGLTEASTNVLPQLWAKAVTVPEALAQMNDVIQRSLDS